MCKNNLIVWCTATVRQGTNPAIAAYRRLFESREIPMKMAKIVLAGVAALTIISSAALAQQALTGTVTQINRINGTIAIQQAQSGTVGASSGGAAQEFKIQGSLLETLHAGDKVTFSATDTGGTKTITKLEKQ
jgi:hypothetical protein